MKSLQILFLFIFFAVACGQAGQNQTESKTPQSKQVNIAFGKGPDASYLHYFSSRKDEVLDLRILIEVGQQNRILFLFQFNNFFKKLN